MELKVPETSLIVLCGTAGSGKSTFAKKNFKPTEIISSDYCRAMICDDESNMEVSREAFELFYFIIEKRMMSGRIVVADSTALSYDARHKLLKMAGRNNYHTVLIMFDIPLDVILKQNSSRDRKVSEKVISRQYEAFIKSLKYINNEGFNEIVTLSNKNIDSFILSVRYSGIELKDTGPFDIISDIHGCCTELEMLLIKMGYEKSNGTYINRNGRKAIFAGDIVDRGPRILDTVITVANMVLSGSAYYTPGNHCNKFYRYLCGRKVQVKHGLEMTVDEYEKLDKYQKEKLKSEFINLYENAPPYIIADNGNLVIAHAGIKEDMIGHTSKKINDFVLYGDVTGKTDSEGFPERSDWAKDYCGKALIVYGHTPVDEPVFVNNTVNIDQGVSIGGSLTALRYPEGEFVQVSALGTYYKEGRRLSDVREHINPEEFLGPLLLETDYMEKNNFTDMEVKASIDILKTKDSILPWIVYIPPLIPSAKDGNFEEQLRSSIRYFRNMDMKKIVIQEDKGDRNYVAVICRDENVSVSYFMSKVSGILYSMSSKDDIDDESKYSIISKLHDDFIKAGYFRKYNTDFVIFQCSVLKNDSICQIIPTRLLSHSCSHFLEKDNMWQIENINKFVENSGMLKKPIFNIIVTDKDLDSYISKLPGRDIESAIVKPVKVYPKYKEMLVTEKQSISAGESGELYSTCYNLSKIGLEHYIKNKLSRDYFKYIIGCVACNNRILKREMSHNGS